MRIARVLEMLGDGEWHMLEEIQQKAKMDKKQIQRAIEFLRKYNFVVVDETKEKVKLDKFVQKFLTQTATS